MLVSTKFVNARINSMVKGAIAKHQHQKDAHMQSDQSPDTHNTIHWNLSYSIHSLGTDVELSGKFMTWAVGVSDHIRPRWCWLMFMFAVKFKINIKIRIFLFPNSKFGRFSKVKLQICTQINRQKNLHNFKIIRFGMIMKKKCVKIMKGNPNVKERSLIGLRIKEFFSSIPSECSAFSGWICQIMFRFIARPYALIWCDKKDHFFHFSSEVLWAKFENWSDSVIKTRTFLSSRNIKIWKKCTLGWWVAWMFYW